MTSNRRPPDRLGPWFAIPIGAAIGAGLFAITGFPGWIGIGAGIGVAIGAALQGRIRS